MMLFSLILEDAYGNQIDMTTTANQYMTSSVDGLSPPAGTISTVSYAGVSGSYLNNAFIEKRNIVISFEMRGIHIESRRHTLYRIVKPSKYIKIYYKTENIDVYADGYVETCEVDNFKNLVSGQISILCPDPYWYSTSDTMSYYGNVVGGFTFPFSIDEFGIPLGEHSIENRLSILNKGEENGFVIKIEADAGLSENENYIVATNPTIYNGNTGDYLQIKSSLYQGDIITVNTKKGKKSVTLTRYGVETNILNCLLVGSIWLELANGENYFHVEAASGINNLKVTLIHTDAYLGV